jgi:hypothetical protein
VSECMCVCGSECASVSEETCGWCCWDELSAALDAPPSDTAHLRCPPPLRCPLHSTQEKMAFSQQKLVTSDLGLARFETQERSTNKTRMVHYGR